MLGTLYVAPTTKKVWLISTVPGCSPPALLREECSHTPEKIGRTQLLAPNPLLPVARPGDRLSPRTTFSSRLRPIGLDLGVAELLVPHGVERVPGVLLAGELHDASAVLDHGVRGMVTLLGRENRM